MPKEMRCRIWDSMFEAEISESICLSSASGAWGVMGEPMGEGGHDTVSQEELGTMEEPEMSRGSGIGA